MTEEGNDKLKTLKHLTFKTSNINFENIKHRKVACAVHHKKCKNLVAKKKKTALEMCLA